MSISYDAIGNPLNYYNGSSYTFTWTGRRLTAATKGGLTYTYTYNDEGIRTSKTVNDVTTTYYLNGSQIVGEETNGNITLYLYDSAGQPIGMQYHGASYSADVWDTYWFEKNLQGDIVAVYNTNGTKLISYVYDAWGAMGTAYSNGGASTTAVKNPFTYRGYYYDSNLGLYYLNSRYYDAMTGRFINADGSLYHSMLGYNMFAYCNNNPVNYVDYTGESAEAVATFLTWLWGVALAEPTPVGEVVAGTITVAGAIVVGSLIGFGIVEVGEFINEASQTKERDDAPQSLDEPDDYVIPDVEYPGDDPTVAPDGYEWTGPDPQGGERGGYKNKNPQKKDSWHPDFNHKKPKGPHWDYNDVFKKKWAITRENGKTVIRYWIKDKIIIEVFKN